VSSGTPGFKYRNPYEQYKNDTVPGTKPWVHALIIKVFLIGKRRRAEFTRDIHHRSLPGTEEEGTEKYRCTGDNPFQQPPLLLAKAQLLNRE
jgi:hypothetical protein